MIRVEHEMHQRRKSRNIGVGLCLVGVIVVVFGLSVVKVTLGHNVEAFDHVARPALEQVAD